MKEFLVEEIGADGVAVPIGQVKIEQNLLNDLDLEHIALHAEINLDGKSRCMSYIWQKAVKNRMCLIIRGMYDTLNGYYIKEPYDWAYGSLSDAENTIKKRL